MPIHKLSLSHGRLKEKAFWWTYVKSRPQFFLIGIFAVLVTNITEIINPKLVQFFLDHLQGEKIPTWLIGSSSQETIYHIGFTLVGVLLVQMFFRGLWRVMLARESHISAATMKSEIWKRVAFYPKKAFEKRMTIGHLMSVATSDVGTARFLFGFTLVALSNSVFLGILALASMLWIDPEITIYTVILFSVIPFIVNNITKKFQREYDEAQKRLSTLNEEASLSVANVKLQKLSSSHQFWYQKLSRSAEIYRAIRYQSLKTSLRFILVFDSTPLLSYALLFGLGLNKLTNGELTIGEFIALQSYIFLLQVPFEDIGFLVSEFQKGFTSLRRVMDVFNEPLDARFNVASTGVRQSQEVYGLNNVSFSHGSQKIFSDLSFTLQQGQWLGIKGPIGAGKSTLLELLMGLREDFGGEIKLFGRDIKSYSMEELRSLISYVPQKNFLFADTIKNNITLGKEMTANEVSSYLQKVDISEDVGTFSTGSETLLGEWGVNLSGGQKQRLSIARALAQNKAILIMDDCLSAVDTVTEEKILNMLKRDYKDTTIIWVAHRDSTLRYCDQVVEL
jgi:ATP-binding cassette subfamily B multidrug efflux pump